jgi:hypothetical protein
MVSSQEQRTTTGAFSFVTSISAERRAQAVHSGFHEEPTSVPWFIEWRPPPARAKAAARCRRGVVAEGRAGGLEDGRRADLPPPYRLVSLRELGDAHAHAVRIAASEGAGTLVVVRRYDLAEFAVVLEPEEPLRTARRALYAGMDALAAALAAACPPEKPIAFTWPDAIRVDGALIGGARLAWPPDGAEDAPPAWLVFSAMLRLATVRGEEPGARPEVTSLAEEGFDEVDGDRLLASFTRHLMVAFDDWGERGFRPVGERYLAQLEPAPDLRRGLAVNGDLLVQAEGEPEPRREELVQRLAEPGWLRVIGGRP